MKGRPLTNLEFWSHLVAKNTGRTDPLRHRNKLLLLLAGLSGLRESELTLITIDLFFLPTGLCVNLLCYLIPSPEITLKGHCCSVTQR